MGDKTVVVFIVFVFLFTASEHLLQISNSLLPLRWSRRRIFVFVDGLDKQQYPVVCSLYSVVITDGFSSRRPVPV